MELQDEKTLKYIKKAVKIHGDKYDYSKTKYVKAKIYITIICDCGNEFDQRPDHHLGGSGCPSCGDKRSGESHKLTQEEFLKRAIVKHGYNYDYSKVKYDGHEKLII